MVEEQEGVSCSLSSLISIHSAEHDHFFYRHWQSHPHCVQHLGQAAEQ